MKIEILHFDKFKFDHEEQLHDIYIKRISQFRNIITDIKTVKINNKGIENRIVKKKVNECFVSLDEKGEHFSTEDLKVFLFNNNFKNLKFGHVTQIISLKYFCTRINLTSVLVHPE